MYCNSILLGVKYVFRLEEIDTAYKKLVVKCVGKKSFGRKVENGTERAR